jgi:hypothetical protein
MSGQLPARLDREAFDRVLRRAAELQAHNQDIGEGLSEDEVLSLGTEVGIPESHLRQALIEERTQTVATDADGALDRMFAPAIVSAARVVHGTQESIGAELTAWLDRNETLSVQRSTPGLVSWEQAGSFSAAMRRVGWALNSRKSRPFLDRARTVTAVVTPLEDGFCHVTLVADLKPTRAGYVGGGGAVTAGLTIGSGIATFALGVPAALAIGALVPAFAIGFLISRSYRPIAARTRLGLERALDHLELRPSLPAPAKKASTKSLGADVSSVVREIGNEVRKAISERSK